MESQCQKKRVNPKIFDRNKLKDHKAWNNLSSTNAAKEKQQLKNDTSFANAYDLKINLEPLLAATQYHHHHQTILTMEKPKTGKSSLFSSSEELEKQCSLLNDWKLQQEQQQQQKERNAIELRASILPTNTAKDTNLRLSNKLSEACLPYVPWVALVISLIQIFMFSFATEGVYHTLMYTPYQRYQIWRFWSYTLLHSDKIHLMINIALQFLTSFFLEIEQGHLKVLFIYVMGGISGSLGTSVFQPRLLMIGSSAGVYSLLMSHVPHLIMNFRILPYRYFRTIAVIILCASDIGFSIYHCLIHSNQSPQISLAAHLCGALAGFLLAFIIYSKTENKLFKVLQYLSMSIFSIFLISAIFFNFNCKTTSENRLKCFL